MNRFLFALQLVVIVMVLLISCGGGGGITPDDKDKRFTYASSNLERNKSPDSSGSEISELVSGNSEFAWNLYRAIESESDNLFYSPFSISIALAMTYAGARGETETQMADTLEFKLSQERLHPAFNKLDLELAKRGEGAKGQDDKKFRLRIANSIWGQKDYYFLPEFLDVLALNYGAGMRLLDFIGAPEQSRIVINDWVQEKTEDKIKNLIPKGLITSITRMVLTNAIYFNAAWLNQFEANMTRNKPFYLISNETVDVPMMEQLERFKYAKGDGWQAVELPYDGNEISMIIFLPDKGKLDAFEENLDSAWLQSAIESLSDRAVHLFMPKFKIEASFLLSETLSGMGMPIPFLPGVADFSGMDGTHNLFISEVVHKAFVNVDEKGTEAAAATAVIMEFTSVPDFSNPVEFNINSPFIFMIRDIPTGSVLFVGRVMNPSGE